MSCSRDDLAAGLAALSDLLEQEYGHAVSHWAEAAAWGDLEKRQISRALQILLEAPIAEPVPLSPASLASVEVGAKRDWKLADAKIEAPDWEQSWQWQLLAAIDNASKEGAGGMVTPSDPRMFVLRLRYERGLFAALAGYLADIFCERMAAQFPVADPDSARTIGGLLPDLTSDQGALLQRIPGLEAASASLLAGILFMIDRLGPKAFCDWCDECR